MKYNDDPQYIKQVLNGHPAAFAVLVDRYKDLAFTIAIRVVKNHEDAEEVAQDSFVKAYQNLEKFKFESKFSTWLYKIVYFTSIDKIKRKKMEVTNLDKKVENFSVFEINAELNKLRLDEQQKFIKMAIDKLDEEDGLIITLYYLDDIPVKEICEITGLSESNVKVKLHRARKKMHDELTAILKNEIKEIL